MLDTTSTPCPCNGRGAYGDPNVSLTVCACPVRVPFTFFDAGHHILCVGPCHGNGAIGVQDDEPLCEHCAADAGVDLTDWCAARGLCARHFRATPCGYCEEDAVEAIEEFLIALTEVTIADAIDLVEEQIDAIGDSDHLRTEELEYTRARLYLAAARVSGTEARAA